MQKEVSMETMKPPGFATDVQSICDASFSTEKKFSTSVNISSVYFVNVSVIDL